MFSRQPRTRGHSKSSDSYDAGAPGFAEGSPEAFLASPDARDVLSISATDPSLSIYSVNGYPLRTALGQRGPWRWITGAFISIIVWMIAAIPSILTPQISGPSRLLVMASLTVFAVVYLVVPPLSWGKTVPVRLSWLGLLFVLSLPIALLPEFGSSGTWMWIFVGVAAAMQGNSRVITWGALIFLALLGLAVELQAGVPPLDSLSQPAVILSVGAMMAAFSRQRETVRVLRVTQHQLAELAVREERNRVARDMHDILGHSLTVIAVKAELAGRLLELAPEKAAAEIADLEDLARGALEDVRATVGGYRGVSILAELTAAKTAFLAAGITAELPRTAEQVPAAAKELFGWVLREGVTNVIRHADAQHCIVTMGQGFLQVDDDGVGPGGHVLSGADFSQDLATSGNGLKGLAERVSAAGASLEVGRSKLGGFRLRVHL